ncbi:MAG TPA: Uma2 family endonuclease [Ktedonobacteraceae bacterium]
MAVHNKKDRDRVSLEEYFAILEKDPEHRYEYLDGTIYMMTGGSPDHSIIGNNLGRILGNLLQGRRCIVYNSDLYVQLAENWRVCPDVTASCDVRDRGATDAISYPTLVVEVLSPSTEAQDRGKKSVAYRASQTIQEYLLVSSDMAMIELCWREKNGFWSLYTLRLEDTAELTSLNVRFPVAEVLKTPLL